MPVSVIIPALNEAPDVAATVRNVRAERPHEIIVVDGGSTDATCELAAGADRLLCGPRGPDPRLSDTPAVNALYNHCYLTTG